MNSIARHLLISLALLASSSLWAANPTVTVTYFYTDLAGSVVAKTDAQGNVTWRKSYASYGATSERDEDNRRGFTGHAEDPNGLVYMRNRYYDPESGRFWATDAVGLDPNNPATFNRYAYANNNPYKYVDPDGKDPVVGMTVGLISGAIYGGMGAHMAGGSWSDVAVASLVGGAWGAGVGSVDPSLGVGTMMVIGATSAGGADIIGQMIANDGTDKSLNLGSTAGAVAGGALAGAGSATLQPLVTRAVAAGTISETVGTSATSALTSGPGTILSATGSKVGEVLQSSSSSQNSANKDSAVNSKKEKK